MAKKKKVDKETTISDYYDLKTEQIDDLVSALKGEDQSAKEPITRDIGEITGEANPKKKKFDPYKVDKFSHIPVPVKALFIKWWFAGMVCYFFIMGLGININALDQMVITGLILGIVNDVFVNPIFRYMESDSKEYNAYMLLPFPFKAFWTFFANAVYYLGITICVALFYSFLGRLNVPIGIEPLLFATLCLTADMAVIGLKDLIVWLVKKIIKKKREEKTDV